MNSLPLNPNLHPSISLQPQTVIENPQDLMEIEQENQHNTTSLEYLKWDHNNIPDDLQYKIDLSLFAMIFGDKYIKSSKLEGSLVEKNLEFILKILSSNYFQSPEKQKIISELSQLKLTAERLHNLSNGTEFIQNLKMKISSLKESERFLFPGGWISSTGGHLILYEIIASPSNKYKLNLYNTGEGIYFHAEILYNNKKYVNPIFSITEIHKESICSEAFLNCMCSLAYVMPPKNDEDYNSNDIYLKLIHILNPNFVIPLDVQWVSPQESGTCSYKSILAFLKNRLQNEEYNQLLFCIKFWGLANFIQDKERPKNSSEAILLTKASHGLANLTRKNYAWEFHFLSKNFIENKFTKYLLSVTELCKSTLEIAQNPIVSVNRNFNSSEADLIFNFDLTKLDTEFETNSSIVTYDSNHLNSADSSISSSSSTALKKGKTKKPQNATFDPLSYPVWSEEITIKDFLSNWLLYLKDANKTYQTLALYNFEEMFYNFPLELNLKGYSVGEKKSIIHSLHQIAKKYFSLSAFSETFSVHVNLWHIFILMNSIFHEIEILNIDKYGINFSASALFSKDENLHANTNLKMQKKYDKLSEYIKSVNVGKDYLLFDTMNFQDNNSTFWVSEDNVESFADFHFLKGFSQTSKAKKLASPLEKVVNYYANPFEAYKELREVYFLCLSSRNFIKSLKMNKFNSLKVKYEKSDHYSYKIVFYLNKKPLLRPSSESYTQSTCEQDNFYTPNLVKKYLKYQSTQNEARSINKRSMEWLNTEYLNNQDPISNYEINRILDVNVAEDERINLCLNFYTENPFFLENRFHLQFLEYSFYKLNSLGDLNQCHENILNFFGVILKIYEVSEENQTYILQTIFSLGLNYLNYKEDESLLLLLKNYAIKQYQAKKKYHQGYRVLTFLAKTKILSYDEIILALDIILTHQSLGKWDEHTFILLKKLSNIFDNPQELDFIFKQVNHLMNNLDTTQVINWKKIERFTYKCQEWSFNIFNGTLNHPSNVSLDYILGINPNIKFALGKSYSQLIKNGDEWANTNNTIKITKINGVYQLQKFIRNEWYQFSTSSRCLHSEFPYIPKSYKGQIQFSGIGFPYENNRFEVFHWYKLCENHGKFLGMQKEVAVYQLENKDGKWILEDIENSCIYATLDILKAKLPPELLPIKQFSEAQLALISFWIGKQNHALEKIIFNKTGKTVPLSISKKHDKYVMSGFEGYHLCENPNNSSPFKTLPPFLHMKNSKGKIFMLVPINIFEMDRKDVKDPLHILHKLESDPKNSEVSFYLYEIDERSNHLIPYDLNTRIYLSFLYFIDQNYNESYQLLNKCVQKIPFDQNQVFLLTKFYLYYTCNESELIHPLLITILLKIILISFEANEFNNQFNNEFAKLFTIMKNNKLLLNKYFQFWNSIPAVFRFNNFDELFLLSFFDEEDIEANYVRHRSYELLEKKDRLGYFEETKMELNFEKVTECPFETQINDKFDYSQILKSFSKISLNTLNTDFIKKLEANHSMALWIACLSDKVNEMTLASYYILFVKARNKKKITSSIEQNVEFLQFALVSKDKFKIYLMENKNSYTGSTEINLNYAKWIIEQWKRFIEENKNTDFETIAIQRTGLFNESFTNRRLLAISSTQPQNSISLFPSYNLNIETLLLFLKQKRTSICSLFLKRKESVFTVNFLPRKLSDKMENLLNEHPIARELYEAYSSKIELNTTNWEFIPGDLRPLSDNIKSIRNSLIQEAQVLKTRIEERVNATLLNKDNYSILELEQSLKQRIDILSFQKPSITVDSLILLILTKNWNDLTNRNFFLSSQDLQTLFTMMLEWMLKESEIDIYKRALDELSELISEIQLNPNLNKNLYAERLASILTADRFYDIATEPEFLAFEYLSKVLLRKNQVEKIQQALDDRNPYQIVKLNMAQGKTTILLPFICKMIANGIRFPIIIAPSSLFEEYLKNIKEKSEQFLSQKVFTFSYNRSSSSEVTDLHKINNLLQSLLIKRGILLITAESLKAIFLKYQELLVLEEETSIFTTNSNSTNDLKARRMALGEIILMLNKGHALIDEGHLVLKSLTEMNFTLAATQPIKESEIKISLRIFKELKNMNFDFVTPLPTSLQDETTEIFQNQRNALIEKLYPKVTDFQIREYLQGHNFDYYSKIEKVDPDFAAEIAWVKEEIWKLLPFTLSKSLNHHYGRNLNNPDVEYAIPYIGAQKQSPLSEFGHKGVIINCTIQLYIQEGLTLRQFSNWIIKLKKQWISELVNNCVEDASMLTRPFIGDRSFSEIDLKNESVLNSLYEELGKNPTIIFDYLEKILLPSIKLSCEKLNSNELDLGDYLFNHVLLFSGTPYNSKTYPESFQPLQSEELDTNEIDDDDESRIHNLFYEKSSEANFSEEEKKLIYVLSLSKNQKVGIANTESTQAALEEIKLRSTKNHLGAFIDLGAYFKDHSNLQVAEMILNDLPHIEGIIYFDDVSNQLMCLPKQSRVPEKYVKGKFPLQNLFAFFDNIHTFGADIELYDTAHAIVSFNQQTCLYELLQAIKRMRKDSQTFSYLVSNSIKNRISQWTQFDVRALFLMSILNEAHILNKEIEMSTKHKLKHFIKKDFINSKLRNKFHALSARKILIESNEYKLSGEFSQQILTSTIFDNYCHYLKQNFGSKYENQWHNTIEKALKLLPKSLKREDAGSLNQEIQKQEEKQIELLLESNNSFEPFKEHTWNVHDLFKFFPVVGNIEEFWHKDFNQLITYKLNDFVNFIDNKNYQLFDDSILISHNLAKTSQLDPLTWKIPLKPVDYFLQLIYPIENDFKSFYVVISLQEMNRIKKALKDIQPSNERPRVTLFSIQGDIIAGDEGWLEYIKMAMVQMKIFDGREDFSNAEIPLLRNWILNKESILTDLFAKLHHNREKTTEYGTGTLFKLIKDSIEIQREQTLSRLNPHNHLLSPHAHKRSRTSFEEISEENETIVVPPSKKLKGNDF